MSKLTEDFLLEYFKMCFRSREIIEVGITHLKFQFLPTEAQKELWKTIKNLYQTRGELPSIGQISQLHGGKGKEDLAVLELLSKIKQVEVPNKDTLLKVFEDFIKDSISVEFYDKFAEYYNNGNREGARLYLKDKAKELTEFSVTKELSQSEKIFGGFKKRQERRELEAQGDGKLKIKVPLGIDELDDLLGGGIDITDTFLLLAQSGVGKTKALRWFGVSAARRGFKVLHFQLEGAKVECEDGYDATWSAQSIYNLEYANIDSKIFNDLIKISKQVTDNGGDVWIEAFETFNSATLIDIRNKIVEFEKNNGQVPDLILIDYMELAEPGDGKKYAVNQERFRREAIANGLKNLAVEFKTRIGTATQGSTVDPENLNNPDFVMTRYDISEFKGALKPFSLFFTLNQTRDEYDSNIMRLYTDKIRKKKGNKTIRICQNYNFDRFYDRLETIKTFYPEAHETN